MQSVPASKKLVVIVGGLFYKQTSIDNLSSAVSEAYRGQDIFIIVPRTDFFARGRRLLDCTSTGH